MGGKKALAVLDIIMGQLIFYGIISIAEISAFST